MPIHFYTIAAKCKELLEAAHEHIGDDRYDMIGCCAAGQLKLISELSDQLRRCSDASTKAIRLSSAIILCHYSRKV